MLTKSIYPTIVIFLIMVNPVLAQFDIRLTSAYGSMSIKHRTSLNIYIKPESFVTAGLQADYYITDYFGVGIGADYYLQESKFDVILSDYSHSYRGIDTWESDPIPREYVFTIKSNIPNIMEQNKLAFIDFPVSAIYTFPVFNYVSLTTRLGFKVGVPLHSNYVLNESDLYSRIYFEEWDLELFNIPAHGLYDSRTDWHPEGDININTIFSVFSEVGLDFPFSPFKIRLSGYFSYGLNNINYENKSSLICWREDYNHILSLTESYRMMQIGVKLGLGIDPYRKYRIKYKSNMKICPAYR